MNMKRIFSAVLAGIMVIGMSSSAMAAPSITAVLDTNNVQASEGEITILKEVDTTNLPEEGKKGVEALVAAEKGTPLSETFKEAGLDTLALNLNLILIDKELKTEDKIEVKTEDLKVLTPVVDLIISGVTPTKENPVDVTFTVNNVTEDLVVYVLHFCDEHGWELLETEKVEDEDNQIKAAFHSASPVALVYTDKKLDEAVSKTPAAVSKSPATK